MYENLYIYYIGDSAFASGQEETQGSGSGQSFGGNIERYYPLLIILLLLILTYKLLTG